MEYLESLVRKFKFTSNRNRTNLGGETMFYGNRKCLVKGIYSNTRRQGEILEHVRSMLGPEINAVCINKNVVCGRHRDRKNCGPSFVCFLGRTFTGGALCLEDGRRFEEKYVWHGPFDGAAITHWNEPHEGLKYSVVAFTSKVSSDAPIAQDATFSRERAEVCEGATTQQNN